MQENIIYTIVLIVAVVIMLNGSKYFFKRMGQSKKVNEKRVYYISKSINVVIVTVAIFLCAAIWSMKFDGILIFISSIFAVIGVALFAQWSILSNITSSIIIFFTFPAKVGEKIKVVDGDNSVVGKIVEISLFQIQIMDEEGNLVLYPNSLFMQKPIVKINKSDSVILKKEPEEELKMKKKSKQAKKIV